MWRIADAEPWIECNFHGRSGVQRSKLAPADLLEDLTGLHPPPHVGGAAWVCAEPASSQTTRRAMYAITIASCLKTVSKMLLQQVAWGMPG